jgi:hypothetical protein
MRLGRRVVVAVAELLDYLGVPPADPPDQRARPMRVTVRRATAEVADDLPGGCRLDVGDRARLGNRRDARPGARSRVGVGVGVGVRLDPDPETDPRTTQPGRSGAHNAG